MFTCPPDDTATDLGAPLSGLNATLRSNEEQSRTLAALRDTLLPKLMSGEMRVHEAEQRVAEIV